MNTKQKNQTQETPDILDEIKNTSYFQWLVDNRQTIPYVFIAIIILIAISFKFTSGRESRAETSYLQAENAFITLSRSLQGEASEEEGVIALKNLKLITDTYPDLHSRYDGLIAQILILKGKGEEAKEYANRCLERTTQDHLKVFNEFAKITLLIANQNYDQALSESKMLKDKILEETKDLNFLENSPGKFKTNLFAYNLLRIAMLEKEAGTPQGEQDAWKEWESFADISNNIFLAGGIFSIGKQFQIGNFTLSDYMKARKLDLN